MKLQTKENHFWLGQAIIMSLSTLAAAQISATSSPTRSWADAIRFRAVTSVSTTDCANPLILPTYTAENSLPDAPSVVAAQEAQQVQPAAAVEQRVPPRPKAPENAPGVDSTFLIANGLLLGSTIANVEMISRCRPGACQAVPDGIRNRGDLYGIGIPSSLAVTYISYRLKRSGTKMWLLPVVLFTAGNVVYAAHAAHYTIP